MKVEILDDGIITISDVLTHGECNALIQRGEALGFEEATVLTQYGHQMIKDIRNNDRVVFDDFELSSKLMSRVSPFIHEILPERNPAGLNERFRFYRYGEGQRFKLHRDGHVDLEDGRRSEISVLFYLNDDFVGGETVFSIYEYQGNELKKIKEIVKPVTGSVLMFLHPIFHEGALVTDGFKYVLRSDIFYSKENE